MEKEISTYKPQQLENYVGRLQERQKDTVNRFKVGDIVTPIYINQDGFYGVVIDVLPAIGKIVVDYNGSVSQHDPSDVRVVVWQAVKETDFKNRSDVAFGIKTARRGTVTGTSRKIFSSKRGR